MNLDNYTPKGELEGFPKEVIAKMLEEQVKQGNIKNIEVFENRAWSGKAYEGFEWNESGMDCDFWSDVIKHKNFDLFFTKYPKHPIAESKYPKVMMVSNTNVDWDYRVVFMEKKGCYLAWDYAKTLEEAEHETNTCIWYYAKDIEEIKPPTNETKPSSPELIIQDTLLTLEERIEAIEKHLNLNK